MNAKANIQDSTLLVFKGPMDSNSVLLFQTIPATHPNLRQIFGSGTVWGLGLASGCGFQTELRTLLQTGGGQEGTYLGNLF